MPPEQTVDPEVIGSVKAALVLIIGGERKAIVTSMHARTSERKQPTRVTWLGPVVLNDESSTQVRTVIMGILDRMTTSLGLGQNNFELSITNPGVSSTRDTGLAIEGFSAELPMFLAMLSSALQLPIPRNFVATGHISSLDGSIAPVSGLIEKLQAAATDSKITRFVFPDLKGDHSLQTLTPRELQDTERALAMNEDNIEQCPVKDISQAIEQTFTEEGMVLGSLNAGYYASGLESAVGQSAVGRTLSILTHNIGTRFWRVLESHLLDCDIDFSKILLARFASFHMGRSAYPAEFGQMLQQLLISLPPAVKRDKHLFPVLPMKTCIQLSQWAGKGDYADVQLLFACTQDSSSLLNRIAVPAVEDGSVPHPFEPAPLLDHFLKALAPRTVVEEVLLPIDQARATYQMKSVRVENYAEFCDTVISFYAHLLRHLGRIPGSVDNMALAPDALDLVERAFSDQGGMMMAVEESKSAIRGGLRYILDRITERVKAEEREKYVRMVFKSMVDPQDFETKVSLMDAFFKRVGSNLPEDIQKRPPEQFATDYELVIKTYSESLEKMIETLKTL